MWAAMAWETPMVVVLFPSPNGVGVILDGKALYQYGALVWR